MRKPTMTLVLVAALGAAVMAAPTLYAQDNQPSPGPAMPHGMMGGQGSGMMGMGGGMMGMMNMMNMMQQMTEMMGHCNRMMSEHRPRGEERKPASEPGKNG